MDFTVTKKFYRKLLENIQKSIIKQEHTTFNVKSGCKLLFIQRSQNCLSVSSFCMNNVDVFVVLCKVEVSEFWIAQIVFVD